jgi:putative transposase
MGIIQYKMDECLKMNWFISLKQSMEVIGSWRIDYIEGRPHTSLGGLTPWEYIENNDPFPENWTRNDTNFVEDGHLS